MKIFLSVFIMLSVVCSHALANVTRIYKDNFFSGSIQTTEKTDRLRLHREELKVFFPVMELDGASLKKVLNLDVTYIIENRSKSTIELPLQFLGIKVYNPFVMLNKESLPTVFAKDSNAEQEFLVKITEHRYHWDKQLYEQYLMNLYHANSKDKSAKGFSFQNATLDDFVGAARGIENMKDIFPDGGGLSIISFNAALLPGINYLNIKYRQGMYVDGRTSYIGRPEFKCGFEYLLYPAFTWELHPDFDISISVFVPDFIEKGWLWDKRVAVMHKSNISFQKNYDAESGRTTYFVRSNGFPASVFSFIVQRGLE